jgi:phosphomannomutase
VDDTTRAQLAAWCAAHRLDALVSTDGDADRPLVTDATGRVIPGDVLGALSAQALGAKVVCTPVSSNTLIDQMGGQVIRTRIGSPFVIAAMTAQSGADVVGYEANGGFLLGFDAMGPAGPLPPLMTRDFVLPILAPLAMACAQGLSLAALWATLPARFTAADRVKDVPTAATRALLDQLTTDPAARAAFFADMPAEQGLDLTDGLRVTFTTGEIVHLRPSGNAPECRCYAEAATPERAEVLVAQNLLRLQAALVG